MEVLALLPIVWLIVWLMSRPKAASGREALSKVKLRNAKDPDNGYDVVEAWKDHKTGQYGAKLWMPGVEKATYLKAGSKEELEEEVRKTREELAKPD